MRLIDKDRLLKGSNHYWLEMENFGDIEAIDVRFIEMAEEIKAIPIEWFKKKIDWHCENAIYGVEVYQWVLNRWYEDKENWEKENENN